MIKKVKVDDSHYKKALLIRRTEDKFLDLFDQGKMNGTVHTCNGQEFSGVAFCSSLDKSDFIFSNHRCHGHYIAHTGDVSGLILELMGKNTGTCAGIGSSQHLYNENFYSNGLQGGGVPVAAGIALSFKRKKEKLIGIVFIGDGTLGEGVVYETLNLISLLDIPLLIVCENNQYAQSTKIDDNLAGSIVDRIKAFDIQIFHSNTWELDDLFDNAAQSIEFVRQGKPAFHLVDTYRLNHHSKSDDNRCVKEVEKYVKKDPLNIFKDNNPDLYNSMLAGIDNDISKIIDRAEEDGELSGNDYYDFSIEKYSGKYVDLENVGDRVVNRINLFFDESISKDKSIVFIGEDVLSPYGGAFKVAKGLSEKYPENVISTPISEQAITGLANGLALGGFRPYLEIMFGDFITLAMDQIVNHASKFYHMYNKQVHCPIVIRTPMGGGRGYGPTHSQTLDKILVGIDNVSVIALNSFIDPKLIYHGIHDNEKNPVLVIENKVDYGRFVGNQKIEFFNIKRSLDVYPIVKCSPVSGSPSLTLVTYGGISVDAMNQLHEIFKLTDLIPELIVLSKISPLDISPVLDSVKITKRIVTVEEGSKGFGIGAEIISQVNEALGSSVILSKRIGAKPVPIPSARSTEDWVLPNTTLANDIAMEIAL
jgi:2-oxoisovalerate dehydrogenase E1 component